MRARARIRSYAIFISALMLGILGNLLAEFLIALWYPTGVIPVDKAKVSITLLLVSIIIDAVLLGTIMLARLPE